MKREAETDNRRHCLENWKVLGKKNDLALTFQAPVALAPPWAAPLFPSPIVVKQHFQV